ncbi:Protein CBR-LGC-44 [Caenorhabditis briggsae]|uniref:Protein CBR-LGC-44 n=1 Tax=Caenorhabditis briggsae TaxID=6238 RepID=A8Y496_CAEBR|nr:Protein CBR-LGC-44 [Caenorhabditis briggsae]CAP39716.2 Protein CBR-LGC-44 [Caenorhabditis briggsae]
MSLAISISLLLFLFPINSPNPSSSNFLDIGTTYQAVDYGIATDQHQQCIAWKLWWKTQKSLQDPSASDIDLLALRRAEVWIRNENDAEKYDVPVELLQNFSTIRIVFRNVCRLFPRVLQISSPLAARRSRITLDVLCQTYNYSDPEANELVLNNYEEAQENAIGIDQLLFLDHQSVMIVMPAACNSSENDEKEIAKQYYLEKYGDFSFNVSNLNIEMDKLHEMVHDLKPLDQIMSENLGLDYQRPLPSSTILPFLRKIEYDARQPPTLHVDDTVTVKVGISVQSMSNFELSTMDYDLDAWVRMSWIDPRLRHDLSRPILVNDYTFLKMIWRPDPIFTNAKYSTFHKVTYLNFYLFIFPDGKIFMDMRVYLKPTAAQIVLCKYPHDNPAVSLKISSMGFTQDVVKLEWFSNSNDAIRIEKNVRIPELSIRHLHPDICNGVRKSGVYSCLEAKFYMHREVGYHIANTYIPTAICVVFSWISVWLPEEFVEGRIFVSLTVFLTLSAENNSAKEELPKVSYVKAIDIWFGFTSTFVFVTMLQALVVISLEHNSKRLRLKSESNLDGYSKYQVTKSMLLSRYYHRMARQIDTFCKVMYPVIFILFLMFYVFVITQGDERKYWSISLR